MAAERKLNRREFLKISAITVLGAAMQACAKATPTPAPTKPAAAPTATPKPVAPTATPKPVEPTKPAAPKFSEAPMLADLVKAGKIPPLDQRIPTDPLVVEPVEELGQYGGTWRQILVGDGSGWFRMTNYVEPFLKWKRDVSGFYVNLLQSYQWNATATELTCQFRKGIKWSDGKPLTANDFMFYWDDMVLDQTVKLVEPTGARIKGELMKVQRVDDYTIKFTFVGANPLFLPYMTRGCTRSSWFMVPAHYMKQHHPKYNKDLKDANALLDRYNFRDRYPDMPTYTAWKLVEWVSGQRQLWERNPYYWKVDPKGNQLPYIDKVDCTIVAQSEIVTMKAIAGEIDCQFRDFPIKDVPLLKENEKKGDYRIIMWTRGDYAWPWIILYYDYPDAEIVDIMYNQDFRKALSHAINRKRINDVVSLGLAVPRQSSMSADSAEFQTPEGKKVYQAWATLATEYSPDKAKEYLDKANVKDVNNDKLRERPSGKPLELIVDIPSTDRQSIDAMDLVKQDWEAVGLKTTLNVIDGTIVTQRTVNGEIMIRAWGSACAWGLISAPPVWTPIENVTYCVGGPRFGLYYQTGGKQGVAPRPGSFLEKLQKAYDKVISIVDDNERTAELLKAYQIHIDDGPIHIGTVGEHPSPAIAKNNFRNVPKMGIPGPWDLGYPGTSSPEQFFFKK